LKIAFLVAVAIAVFGFLLMELWNHLMPAIFGLHAVSYWQALGLLVLSKVLFGSIGGRGRSMGHWRQRMIERWEQMTPEEREKFRTGLRRGCGPFDRTPAAPKI
jgi:hypothetical protein